MQLTLFHVQGTGICPQSQRGQDSSLLSCAVGQSRFPCIYHLLG